MTHLPLIEVSVSCFSYKILDINYLYAYDWNIGKIADVAIVSILWHVNKG